jgi:hypothetical protein
MRPSRLAASAALLAVSVALSPAALAQSKLAELPPNYAPGDKGLKWGGCPEGLPKGCQLAVLNGDPAKPGADVFLKLPGKSKVPAHKHTSVERIVVVEGDLSLTYDGHKPLAVKRGTYHYGPAEAVHEAQCVSAQPCVLFISFEKPIDLIQTPMAAAAATGGTKASAPATDKKPKKGGC